MASASKARAHGPAKTEKEGGNVRSLIVSLIVNVLISTSKGVAFFFTGSSSMLAEAIHTLADSINELLLMRGMQQAERKPSKLHPFGYGRHRYVSAYLVALIVFFSGGLFSLYEGIHKIQNPAPLTHVSWAFAVLAISATLDGWSLRVTLHATPPKRGRPLFQRIREAKIAELLVVYFEDVGALIGVAIAFIGVVATMLTGNSVFDGIGTIGIGVLMVAIAATLYSRTRSLIIGEAAQPDMVKQIKQALLDDDKTISGVRDLRTQHLGPSELLVAAQVTMRDGLSGKDIIAALDAARSRVRKEIPRGSYVYIQPVG